MNEHIQQTEVSLDIPPELKREAVKVAAKDASKKQAVQTAEDLGTPEVLN